MSSLDMLGDLQPVEQCPVCASGNCSTRRCSANYRWSEGDGRYARCGCFESYWFDMLSTHPGHGVAIRTRQYTEISHKSMVGVGWIIETGHDEHGFYVDLEEAQYAIYPRTLRLKDQTDQSSVRYYIGAVLGISLLRQTREDAVSDSLACAQNKHAPELPYLHSGSDRGAACGRCGITVKPETGVDPALPYLRCNCGTAVTFSGRVRQNQPDKMQHPSEPGRYDCPACSDNMTRVTASPSDYCELFGHICGAHTARFNDDGHELSSQGHCLRCKQNIVRQFENYEPNEWKVA